MGVPKGKTSKANRRMNRAGGKTLAGPAMSECQQCHASKLPHQVCPECGYQKGVPVVVEKEKAE